jgi:hypothetical protein
LCKILFYTSVLGELRFGVVECYGQGNNQLVYASPKWDSTVWSQLQRLQSQNLQPSTVHITATFQATNVLDIVTSTRIIFLVQAQTLQS